MTTASSPDAPLVAESSSAVARSLVELRALLGISKKERPTEWQTFVASHVSALCADYPTQPDERIALAEISLVGLAAKKGSNDARKRALKPVRWISSGPARISDAFEDVEEARAAVQVLQPIRADWVTGYVQGELALNKWPALTGELLAWQIKASASVEAVLNMIAGVEIAEGTSAPGRVVDILNAVMKPLAKARLASGAGFMGEIEQLALKSASSGTPGTSGEQNEKRAARRAIVLLISQVSSIDPAVLVQGGAIAAVRSLNDLSRVPDSISVFECELMCRRLIAMMALLVPAADHGVLSHYRNLWGVYRECAPRADQLIKNALRENRALSGLMAPSVEDTGADFGVTSAIEAVLTELVSNWDSFSVEHEGDPAVRQLSMRIEDLMKHLRIIRFGREGEVLPFDPLRHNLPESTSTPPAKVRISKPGLALERPDGTSRILLPAIVAAA